MFLWNPPERHHNGACLAIAMLCLALVTALGGIGEGSISEVEGFSSIGDTDGACPVAAGSPDADSADGSSGGSSCGCGGLKRGDFSDVGGAREKPDDPKVATELELQHGSAGETLEEASIVYLKGGEFTMGLVPDDEGDPTVFPSDGEGPRHKEMVEPFGIGAFEVSNHRFAEFVKRTGYITESESFGWSFAVEAFISPEVNATITQQVDNAPWWLPVNGADWRHPNGPDTSIDTLMDHPVSQVSMADAEAFCRWSRPGGRLPSEMEWEFAARGGREQRRFPWGNNKLTGKKKSKHRMNIWQSEVDEQLMQDGKVRNLYSFGQKSLALVKEYYSAPNLALDGYKGTAPVHSYGPQNAYGLYNIVGNVWEWTSSLWRVIDPRAPPVEANTVVKKGGSFLCNPATCNRFRCSARMMFTADSAASNVGFRCAYPVDEMAPQL
mmetsp:Transcript_22864/g.50087  ORF Transcript_22864/g.50087 Transcript_22864/m.50087 type:complete len:439 (+) Transcript_22864:144-1460(+)